MAAEIVLRIRKPGERTDTILDCLREATPGTSYPAPDESGEMTVYLNAQEVTAEAGRDSLRKVLDRCTHELPYEWSDYVEVVGPAI